MTITAFLPFYYTRREMAARIMHALMLTDAGDSRGQPPAPNPETTLPSDRFGKFVRAHKLGAGGMGEVWRAWDTELSRWVALKFLIAAQRRDLLRALELAPKDWEHRSNVEAVLRSLPEK